MSIKTSLIGFLVELDYNAILLYKNVKSHKCDGFPAEGVSAFAW